MEPVILTDPKPIPVDPRCPTCHSDESARVLSGGFGDPHEVCGKCGHEFPAEDARG